MASPASTRRKRLGSFEILHEIGQGGMGVVYLARQPALDRRVVLKKIRREYLGDRAHVERFHREAQAAASVHHQNVVAVYDSFAFRDDRYIAQEWVPGADLQAILERQQRLPARIAAWIALEIARGLEEIHAREIVHRDLKPANILIGAGGETKIADFGIAHDGRDGLTRPGMTMGSLPYMSPEQLRGEKVGPESDLFNLGVVLFEMLVGLPPWPCPEGDGQAKALLDSMQETPRLSGPRPLRRILRKLLAVDTARRHEDAGAVRRELQRYLHVQAPPEGRAFLAAYLLDEGIVEVRRRPPTVKLGAHPRSPKTRWALGGVLALTALAAAHWSLRSPDLLPATESADETTLRPQVTASAGDATPGERAGVGLIAGAAAELVGGAQSPYPERYPKPYFKPDTGPDTELSAQIIETSWSAAVPDSIPDAIAASQEELP